MIGHDQADAAALRRIAQRVEDILQAARDRESNGHSLALDIEARFRLRDYSAVQFQLASAILEEVAGLEPEEVVAELLSLGLDTVLQRAGQTVDPEVLSPVGLDEPLDSVRSLPAGLRAGPGVFSGRVVN